MNKIRIIDLLNIIANDIDVPPKQIKYDDKIFEYKLWLEPNKYAYVENGKNNTLEEYCCFYDLNDEVEIIEENKIPEKLSTWFGLEKDNENDNMQYANTNFENIYEKINEIIDYLKSKGE